jgi:prepilin-type N-terminal cleavage/methylation domain-containing protein
MKKLSRKTRAFTLVEIMIVVAIIALLAAIAMPSLLRARKRSQAAMIRNDLRLLDAAIEQFAIEHSKRDGESIAISQWKKYLKAGTPLYETGRDMFGVHYGPQIVGRLPRVSGTAKSALAEVADDAFWSPYNPVITDGSMSITPAAPAGNAVTKITAKQ